MVNSLMLLTHSVAAMQGHEGPARNDHRARLIAKALVLVYRPFVTKRRPTRRRLAGPRARLDELDEQPAAASTSCSTPRWSTGSSTPGGRASSSACRSRPSDAIADAIDTTARGTFWRYPTIRLNQINWYALMYAADATVTGKTDLVRNDMRNQLMRFVRGMRGDSAARRQPRRRACASTTCPTRSSTTR